MRNVLVNRILFLSLFGLTCCHSAPPPAPPPPPPPPEEDPGPPPIPEVVKNEIDLAAADMSGCGRYNDASEQIWGYKVQSDLQLSVLIYDGKILAADAEQLMVHMNSFETGWKERFAKLCANHEDESLADGQFMEGATCLQELLDVQKDYVNGLFHNKIFAVNEAEQVAAQITTCDSTLEPRGDKAYKENPF